MSTLTLPAPATAPSLPRAAALVRREGAIDLLELQLSVARRADRLARHCAPGRAMDRLLWLRAELEIFETKEKALRDDGGVTFG